MNGWPFRFRQCRPRALHSGAAICGPGLPLLESLHECFIAGKFRGITFSARTSWKCRCAPCRPVSHRSLPIFWMIWYFPRPLCPRTILPTPQGCPSADNSRICGVAPLTYRQVSWQYRNDSRTGVLPRRQYRMAHAITSAASVKRSIPSVRARRTTANAPWVS